MLSGVDGYLHSDSVFQSKYGQLILAGEIHGHLLQAFR